MDNFDKLIIKYKNNGINLYETEIIQNWTNKIYVKNKNDFENFVIDNKIKDLFIYGERLNRENYIDYDKISSSLYRFITTFYPSANMDHRYNDYIPYVEEIYDMFEKEFNSYNNAVTKKTIKKFFCYTVVNGIMYGYESIEVIDSFEFIKRIFLNNKELVKTVTDRMVKQLSYSDKE